MIEDRKRTPENPDRNFKEQVTNAAGKTQSEKVSLTGTQIAWMICDFSKMIGDDDAILDDKDLPQVQLQNDNVQAFDTKSNEVTSAFANRPIDNILESLYEMQVEKFDYCRLRLMAHRYLEETIKKSQSKARNRDDHRHAIGAPCKGKAEGMQSKCRKQLRERT